MQVTVTVWQEVFVYVTAFFISKTVLSIPPLGFFWLCRYASFSRHKVHLESRAPAMELAPSVFQRTAESQNVEEKFLAAVEIVQNMPKDGRLSHTFLIFGLAYLVHF